MMFWPALLVPNSQVLSSALKHRIIEMPADVCQLLDAGSALLRGWFNDTPAHTPAHTHTKTNTHTKAHIVLIWGPYPLTETHPNPTHRKNKLFFSL